MKIFRVIKNVLYKYFKKLEYLYYKILSDKGFYIKKIQGSRMKLNVNDPGISKELLLYGFHEERTTNIVKKIIKPGMNLIELGANVGYYTLLESRLLNGKGKIFAIEPVPENFTSLNDNIKLNDHKNIETFNLAISDKKGEFDFFLTNESNWGSMVDPSSDKISKTMSDKLKIRHNNKIKVKAISIDDFVKENNIKEVNFIRMDIEGYEIEAIKGMKNTLKSNGNISLLIEIHNKIFSDVKKSYGPTFEFLLNNGFKPKILIAKQDEYYDIKEENFIDLICSYKDICSHLLMTKSNV
tara:strand:+ start:3993 stop:4883 length:891 start_codon:yes stop_codon:yes gene_type:complete